MYTQRHVFCLFQYRVSHYLHLAIDLYFYTKAAFPSMPVGMETFKELCIYRTDESTELHEISSIDQKSSNAAWNYCFSLYSVRKFVVRPVFYRSCNQISCNAGFMTRCQSHAGLSPWEAVQMVAGITTTLTLLSAAVTELSLSTSTSLGALPLPKLSSTDFCSSRRRSTGGRTSSSGGPSEE